MRRSTISLFAAALLFGTTAAVAHPAMAIADKNRLAEDVARDAARHPAEMLDFAHVGHGTRVADFIPGGGYFTRLFAVAVKPGGSVVAVIPAAAAARDKTGAMAAIAANPAYGNITVVTSPIDLKPNSVDVFWTAQNYHDLHNAPAGTTDGANKAIFAAVKPGGYYVVIDHAAVAGSGVTATDTLHRIDPAVVKAEVTAAGFVFDGETKVLANPADPHTVIVFDPAVRGKTDQFAYRFKKPS